MDKLMIEDRFYPGCSDIILISNKSMEKGNDNVI
jgi:hypothetical protein